MKRVTGAAAWAFLGYVLISFGLVGCNDDESTSVTEPGELATISEEPVLNLDGEGTCSPSCMGDQVCVGGECVVPPPPPMNAGEGATDSGTGGAEEMGNSTGTIPTIPSPQEMPGDEDGDGEDTIIGDICLTEAEHAAGQTCASNDDCRGCLNGLVFCNVADASPGCVACLGDGDCVSGQTCVDNECRSSNSSTSPTSDPLPSPSAANGYCEVECADAGSGLPMPNLTNNGVCEDGGAGDSGSFECRMGTDCFDCPPRDGINTAPDGGSSDCPDTYSPTPQCNNDTDCDPCGATRPTCHPEERFCVQCLDNNGCPRGQSCDVTNSGLCVAD